MQAFAIIMHLLAPSGLYETYIIDTGQTYADCTDYIADTQTTGNTHVHFTCEPETN